VKKQLGGLVMKLAVMATIILTLLALLGSSFSGLAAAPQPAPTGRQVEPRAGMWRTWVLASGRQVRVPPPPNQTDTAAEIRQLQALASQRNPTALDQIAFWDTSAPAYRWNEITINTALKNNLPSNLAWRALALVHVAIYDSTIAAWAAKYTYRRPRPSEVDASLRTAIPNPQSPSYPSEHAVAAGAASTVLAYLFPDDAKLFADKANEAVRSRLVAGVQYPSDMAAGLELGRAVGALAIERAKADGSDARWTGSVPTEPGKWNGTNPIFPLAGTWRTWVLSSGNELRPGPPPAYDSPQMATEMTELRNFQRTPKTNGDAFFWEYAVGGLRNYWYWNEQLTTRILEYRLDGNPPRVARAYALVSIATYDAMVGCWDAKYAYWQIRPFQLDPNWRPLFPTPNHPSYPAAHGCLSSAAAGTIAYLFPRDAQMINALADQAAESRIWAGIHYRTDVVTGLALGRAVAQRVIDMARRDGPQ
jgi:membrane-associated phospholipid phosphatase